MIACYNVMSVLLGSEELVRSLFVITVVRGTCNLDLTVIAIKRIVIQNIVYNTDFVL